ncbi:MAG TPA: hypothetical protein VNQ90_03835 [Chthoniobacteraceae bacterium]|nr:hypothetical protein [Chthoniobacteraceae bacterium]
MRFPLLAACLFSAFLPSLAAQPVNLLKAGDAETDAGLAKFIRKPGEGRNGGAAYELSVPESYTTGRIAERVVFPERIAIDPAKTYRLEGWLRSADGENLASAYFGVIMYDANQRAIAIRNVAPLKDTESELLEAVPEGATEVVVARSERWLSLTHRAIAFGAQSDLSDLPNFNVTPKLKEVVARDDKALVATLSQPMERAYPAGTKVRLHTPWPAHLYWIANEWVPLEWKRYETVLTGEAPSGTPKDAFWKGTRYVQVFVQLGNWNRIPKKGARLLFDDISFTEIAPVAPAATE